MLKRTISAIFVSLLVVESSNIARAACGYLPPQARDLNSVRTTYLLLKSSRSTYLLNDDCFNLTRNEFGGILQFKILNRFPKDIGIKTGYVFVKSYRTFSILQPVKIKLSRGNGWFAQAPPSNQVKTLPRLDDRPFDKPLEDWNSAHLSPGDPAELAKRLSVSWHAYAEQDQTLSSTSDLEFWRIDNTFDGTYGSMTDYLLRFEVGTDNMESLVPFQVYIQRQVKRVELSISSNIEALSTTLKLEFK